MRAATVCYVPCHVWEYYCEFYKAVTLFKATLYGNFLSVPPWLITCTRTAPVSEHQFFLSHPLVTTELNTVIYNGVLHRYLAITLNNSDITDFWGISFFINADPRARAYDNGTVLHWACRSEKGNRKLVRLLLKK